jgi:hypothetical protein
MSHFNHQNKLVGRRQLLKTLSIAGGAVVGLEAIPDKWTQPLVQSIYLPAHAQTSLPVLRVGGPVGVAVVNNDANGDKDADGNVLNYFIDSAHAQDSPSGGCISVFVPGGGVGTFQVAYVNGSVVSGDARSDGEIFLGSGGGLTLQGTHVTPTVINGTLYDGIATFSFTLNENDADGCSGGNGGGGPVVTPTSNPLPTLTPTATPVAPTPTIAPPTPTATPGPTGTPV